MDKACASNPAIEIRELDQTGMIAVRGDLESARLREAMKLIGGDVPGKCEIVGDSDVFVAWMAPDEVLVMLPPDRVRAATGMLASAFQDEHLLCVDVSDMRTCIQVGGVGVRDLMAKGSPADASPEAFCAGQFRRTRFAQIQAALWLAGEEDMRILCRRSETDHLLSWLKEMSPSREDALFFASKPSRE